MAIRAYSKGEQKFFEVYVTGFNARGRRVQRKRRTVGNLRDAQKAEFELKRELAVLAEKQVPYRWHEWFDECLKRMKMGYSRSTVMQYDQRIRKWIHPHWHDKEITEISKADVYELIFEKIGTGVSDYSRKTILKLVRRIFTMAVEEGHLDRNPCNGVQVRVAEVEQKVLTNAEVEIFLREAKALHHRFYPIWVVALLTGMRSGEMFALRWTDIDFDARIISVSRQWTSRNGFGPTKTQRSRVVPISDDLLHFLKEWKLQNGSTVEFALPHFPEWERGAQADVTRDFCKGLNLTPIKFHDLRATFITNLLARGESLARVMSVVGHTQIKTTNGYLRKAGVEVQGATEKLGYKLPTGTNAKVLNWKKDAAQ